MHVRLVLAVFAVVLAACSTEPEIPTLLVTDECHFDGPTSVTEGETRLTLQRAGLGDYGAAMVRMRDGHDPAELEAFLAATSRIWENRWPDWVQVTHQLRVDDDTVQSPPSDTVLMDLRVGDYALVCFNMSGDFASVAATVEVLARDG